MPRVNHKRLKQLIYEKKSKITDQQLFTSRLLAGHFEDIAAVQTKRYKYNRFVRVNLVWQPEGDYTAFTDNRDIYINTGHPSITKQNFTRQDRYYCVCGLFSHELGHVLYTDFLTGQTHHNYLEEYRWYPERPTLKSQKDISNEQKIWEYVKTNPQSLKMVQMIAHSISNILEDGYIENRVLSNFSGILGYSLTFRRDQIFGQIDTVSDLRKKENDTEKPQHIFESILQIMFQYVKYGKIKYGEALLTDECIQVIFSLLFDLDQALMNPSSKARFNTVNIVLIRCWDYIKDFIETYQESIDSNQEDDIQPLAQILQSIIGISDPGTGNSEPVSEPNISLCPLADKNTRNQTKNLLEMEIETEETGNPFNNSGNISQESKINVTEYEKGRILYRQTDRISMPTGGGIIYTKNDQIDHYEGAAKDIERILDKMAEKDTYSQLEDERTQELNELAQSISYGDIHTGISVKINRISSVNEKLIEQYNQISTPLIAISRQLQRNILRQLKDKQRDGKETGLIMGKHLDFHSFVRNDGKIFYRNNLPAGTPKISVGLLLDESGSMSSCDRITYARAAAIILYDFCQSLHIPIMVYGHSSSYNNDIVELYSYTEFDSIDSNDKYRLMDISARNNNRDGAALRFVAERLSRRSEEIRLLIIVSDGQPNHDDYFGSSAEEDLRGIKTEYRRKGIIFIAAAIGNDKENIKRIYGDSFLDITDLQTLPITLTSVLKRYLQKYID